MNWEKYKFYFDESWWPKIKPFIESKKCDDIYAYLKKKSNEGAIIAPSSSYLWRAFKETKLTDLKCILLVMDPYNKLVLNKPIADGLAISCSITDILQPSLQKFYEGLDNEFDPLKFVEYNYNSDLTYLANQGVLLLNSALTVEANKAGSHLELWKPFILYLFKNVFNYSNIPIIMLGKDAQKYEEYTGLFDDVFKLSHPVSASYNNTIWDTKGVFKQVNKIILDKNNKEINWLIKKKL